MAQALTLFALVVAALFTGAAVYVNAVEHPARRHLDPVAALQEWQPAYKRGAAMHRDLMLHGRARAGRPSSVVAQPLRAPPWCTRANEVRDRPCVLNSSPTYPVSSRTAQDTA